MQDIAQQSTKSAVFLTGASGVVGQALMHRLPQDSILCLQHSDPVMDSNAFVLRGDVTSPKLGLSDQEYEMLVRRVGLIVHSAAVTDFSKSDDEIMRTNVNGTREVANLARRAGVPIYYISTAFIAIPRPLCYLQSKRIAEEALRESAVPHVIVRPSMVVGDSHTGRIAHMQALHRFLLLFVAGRLPMVPLDPETFIDFVAQDYLAEVIVRLMRNSILEGEFWVTAGNKALSIRQIGEVCMENAALFSTKISPPKFVGPDVYERLIRPAFLPALPKPMQKRIEALVYVTQHMSHNEALPSSVDYMEQHLGVAAFPEAKTVLTRNLEHMAAKSRHLSST